jgi:hypothetical protein
MSVAVDASIILFALLVALAGFLLVMGGRWLFGQAVHARKATCRYCGTEVPAGTQICPYCGHEIGD